VYALPVEQKSPSLPLVRTVLAETQSGFRVSVFARGTGTWQLFLKVHGCNQDMSFPLHEEPAATAEEALTGWADLALKIAEDTLRVYRLRAIMYDPRFSDGEIAALEAARLVLVLARHTVVAAPLQPDIAGVSGFRRNLGTALLARGANVRMGADEWLVWGNGEVVVNGPSLDGLYDVFNWNGQLLGAANSVPDVLALLEAQGLAGALDS
jgi:hypothetical protein